MRTLRGTGGARKWFILYIYSYSPLKFIIAIFYQLNAVAVGVCTSFSLQPQVISAPESWFSCRCIQLPFKSPTARAPRGVPHDREKLKSTNCRAQSLYCRVNWKLPWSSGLSFVLNHLVWMNFCFQLKPHSHGQEREKTHPVSCQRSQSAAFNSTAANPVGRVQP